MEALVIEQVLERDGSIEMTGLPYKKGQSVEIIFLTRSNKKKRPQLTFGQFRKAGLIGLWKDREDIQDSSVYARKLREQAQNRRRYDFDG